MYYDKYFYIDYYCCIINIIIYISIGAVHNKHL